MNKVVAIILILILCFGSVIGIAAANGWFYRLHKADDATNYYTLKEVEDACRAMIASYEADKITWEQYKDSDNSEEVSWANQAKMRANRTASNYNNYILENSFVWSDNIPADINAELEIIS